MADRVYQIDYLDNFIKRWESADEQMYGDYRGYEDEASEIMHAMAVELKKWCAWQKLPFLSANELLMEVKELYRQEN